jgi:hypothetical protein
MPAGPKSQRWTAYRLAWANRCDQEGHVIYREMEEQLRNKAWQALSEKVSKSDIIRHSGCIV